MKNILILGSGSREHILAKKYTVSQNVNEVYIIPGNTYICEPNIKCLEINYETNFDVLYDFIRNTNIAMVCVGSEKMLVAGIVDYLTERDIMCFGPNKYTSLLEGSKTYAKTVLNQFKIPTANYESFTNIELATDYINTHFKNHVIKNSGLAGGKGVFLPTTESEAIEILNTCFGEYPNILIEERLYGEEVSLLGFCNGNTISFMPQSQDYKRYYNNDTGPNTGGMGSICPVHILTKAQLDDLQCKIDELVKYFKYKGVLYIGLIVNSGLYNVLEFNCRFGDPEAQVLLTLLDDKNGDDLYKISEDCILENKLNIKWKDGYASNVVCSHHNYPYTSIGKLDINNTNFLLDDNTNLYWSGSGRVVSITAYNKVSLYNSIMMINNNIHKIDYNNKYNRTDIGLNTYIKPDTIINRKISIAILGSTKGSSSQPLIDEIQKNNLNAEIRVIISDKPTSPLLERAKQNNISFLYIPFKKGSSREEYDETLVNFLKIYDIDIVFLIGYMRIVTSVLINQYRNRIFNIHPSLLPKYAGGMDLNVHKAVLENNDKYSGCTLHKVTEVVDGGDIMFQDQVIIDPHETEYTLKEKVQKLEGQCIITCVKVCINGEYNIWGNYGDSGVNISAGNELVCKIKDLNSKNEIGGFCSILEMDNSNYIYGISTDGVGTKLELANKYNKFDGIGIDLVAMSVNDLIANCIKPTYFLDYLAVDKINIDKNYRIIKSITDGCKISGCKLVGGETAEMNTLYNSGCFDLAGFALGKALKTDIPNYKNICRGNLILGLKSSGIHSNGYTLINKLLKYNEYNIDDLLEPTRIYMEVFDIIQKYPKLINGISHITGGGFKDNINRILQGNLEYKLLDWEFPNIFKWIQKYSLFSKDEMLNTFNCGFGMVLIINENYGNLKQIMTEFSLIKIGYIV